MTQIIEVLKSYSDLIHGKGATEIQIFNAEEQLSLKFTEEYRKYLSAFGLVIFDGHELTGIGDIERTNVVTVTRNQKRINLMISKDWYVIEEANIDDIVIWQSANGTIYKTQPGLRPKKIAEKMSEYLKDSILIQKKK